MNLNAAEKNAIKALTALLKMSNVQVTNQTLQRLLWQHPDFPSLASISDTLDELNVTHLATYLSPDRLPEIPLPALAYLQIEGGLMAPIRSISNDTIEWLHTQGGWQSEPLTEFVTKWSGISLLLDPSTQAGETDYKSKARAEALNLLKLPLAILGSILCLCLLIGLGLDQFKVVTYGLLAIKIAGFGISSVLIWYSLDMDNPILRSLCQLNSKTNCSSILQSKAAYVYGSFSWAEVGLFYFGGGLFTLLVHPQIAAQGLLSPLWVFGGAALLYTLYSVYYQAFISKTWCVLCLTIQGLLVLEFALSLVSRSEYRLPQDGASWATMTVCFLLPVIGWVLLKPTLVKGSQTDLLLRSLQRMKFDPIFLKALATQKRVLPPVFEHMKVMYIGNSEAENLLTVVLTPNCSACRRNHKLLNTLLQDGLDLTCRIIFAANLDHPKDESDLVVNTILALPEHHRARALDSWFEQEQNSFKTWASTLPNRETTPPTNQQLELHLRWCGLAGISKTPALFLNSVELPAEYSLLEIKKLMVYFKG